MISREPGSLRTIRAEPDGNPRSTRTNVIKSQTRVNGDSEDLLTRDLPGAGARHTHRACAGLTLFCPVSGRCLVDFAREGAPGGTGGTFSSPRFEWRVFTNETNETPATDDKCRSGMARPPEGRRSWPARRLNGPLKLAAGLDRARAVPGWASSRIRPPSRSSSAAAEEAE